MGTNKLLLHQPPAQSFECGSGILDGIDISRIDLKVVGFVR
jgi:hypothetical protein